MRKLLMAAAGSARFVHVSTSSVFPLDAQSEWDESLSGLDWMAPAAAALAASGADGYSLSKFSAEWLVWSAREQGLPMGVVRLPHLASHSRAPGLNPSDRLLTSVRALGIGVGGDNSSR